MTQLKSFIITLVICIILTILEYFQYSNNELIIYFTFIPFVSFLLLIICGICLFNLIQTLWLRKWYLFLFAIFLSICTYPTLKYAGYLWQASETKNITDQEYFISRTPMNFIFYFNMWLIYTLYLHFKNKKPKKI
jgi:hypothetical protein